MSGAQVSEANTSLNPPTAITIAVDTAYVAARNGQNLTQGVYMMDNQLDAGSTGEGTMELSTRCMDGSLIGFNVVPINPVSGDSVIITGFTVSSGSVFGSSGYPIQQPPIGNEHAGAYWIGQATTQGGPQTYQIQIKVTTGGPRPTSYFVNWDPFITSS